MSINWTNCDGIEAIAHRATTSPGSRNEARRAQIRLVGMQHRQLTGRETIGQSLVLSSLLTSRHRSFVSSDPSRHSVGQSVGSTASKQHVTSTLSALVTDIFIPFPLRQCRSTGGPMYIAGLDCR